MVLSDLNKFLRNADALIIVPPFAGLDRPSLAAHLLQACAREAGFSVIVLYANVALAAEIGESNYQAISYAPTGALLGERFFAAAAYGVPPLGYPHSDYDEAYFQKETGECTDRLKIDLKEVQRLEPEAGKWADDLVRAIVKNEIKVVGCTSTFEQTAASVALLNRIKKANSEIITILGGANCEGEMAEGIMTLGANIDFIFSGESEASLPDFLKQVRVGRLPANRIIKGEPCMDLDALPRLDFAEFYEQLNQLLPDGAPTFHDILWLPFESSRGCWWGEKHHCTFCGLNAETMAHREKSPTRVIGDLQELLKKHPNRRVCMVDNIMPHRYFRTLIPQLSEQLPDLYMFYEEKANLSLDHVLALRSAGIQEIQPGIEALSSGLLKQMDKGVKAHQNIALLRYARAAGLTLNWNLLYGFPNDRLKEYKQTLALIPLIRHLEPPSGLGHLSIDRFSPYFDYPDRYEITNIRPIESYASVLPSTANVPKIAYHFLADYPSESRKHPALIEKIDTEVKSWKAAWDAEDAALPALALTQIQDDAFLLLDTRGLKDTEEVQFLTREQASIVLTGRGLEDKEKVEWALQAKLIVELDSQYVPLVTAEPQLLREFELEQQEARAPRASLPVIQQKPLTTKAQRH